MRGDIMSIERRVLHGGELRVHHDEGAAPKISGYAAMFDSPADIGWFREVIKAGAFDETLANGDDVRALFNHDPNLVLGRTKANTLRLSVDDKGLMYEIDPPDTQFARDLMESIRRGDVSQSSFAFETISDRWRTEDKQDVRELIKVRLFDVSPVTYPAYEETSVGVRSHAEWKKRTGQKQNERQVAV